MLLGLALLGGCYSSPPKFWADACKNETAERRHETPEPTGLVLFHQSPNEALEWLVLTGAAWVEHDVYSVGGALAAVYKEGAGRYSVRLARLSDPECSQALIARGLDPVKRVRIERQGEAGIYDAVACLEANRFGDVAPGWGMDLSPEDRLKGWSAPYALVGKAERDPRSAPDDPVTRSTTAIAEIATGKPVIEQTAFSYSPKTNWFPAVNVCSGGDGYSDAYIPIHAFRVGL